MKLHNLRTAARFMPGWWISWKVCARFGDWRDRHVKGKRMRITGYLIFRHRQTGDHNIRVVREAQTIRPVS
jgi:hypothetical protein